jgi:hypothetical protein
MRSLSAAPRLALALAISICACGPSHHGSGIDASGGGGDGAFPDAPPQPHTLDSISVTPENKIVQLDLNATAQQGFIATGHFLDGVDEDLTATATWTSSNPAVGTMTGAALSIPAFTSATAQTSRITAASGGLSGIAQLTVVAYRKSGPSQDFFFILPYQDPAGAQTKPLDFSTTIPALDVFFLMDTTGSMFGEISNLQGALTGTVVPGIKAAVPNSQFGVGALEDFPVDTYGNTAGSACGRGGDATPDQPLKVRQVITSDINAVQTGVNSLSNGPGAPIGCGNDWPESGLESIYQAATGEGLTGPSPTSVPANHTGIGGVGFRSGTMPIIVVISDADSHGKGETGSCATTGEGEAYAGAVASVAHTRQNTKDALTGICGRFVGIAAIQTSLDASCSPQNYMTDLATSTGSRVAPSAWDVGTRPAGCAANQCCTGQNGAGQAPDGAGLCPVVFDVSPSGTGVGANIATGISLLARFATFDVPTDKQGVGTDIDGVALPAGHTTADFIKMVTPVSFVKPAPPPVVPDPTFDATTFHNVTPGTKVSFSVNAFNDFVMSTGDAQIFRATIRVLAGGCTPLDQRDVLILVPPIPVVN